MAEVWESVDEALDRTVAIKVVREAISSQPEFAARFRREARLAASLEHQNILPIYSFAAEQKVAYIVMPCLKGGTLLSRIQASPPGRIQVCEWVQELASALDYAHSRGIIHRDIKPQNILFGSEGRPVVADFGLAKSIDEGTQLTMAGTVMGTPTYLSPEQARGEALDGRSDQYALAVLAFRLVTGHLPYPTNIATPALLHKILFEPPQRPTQMNPRVPRAVDDVFQRAMAKSASARYPDCQTFASELRDAFLQQTVEVSVLAEAVPRRTASHKVAVTGSTDIVQPQTRRTEYRRTERTPSRPPAPAKKKSGAGAFFVAFLLMAAGALGALFARDRYLTARRETGRGSGAPPETPMAATATPVPGTPAVRPSPPPHEAAPTRHPSVTAPPASTPEAAANPPAPEPGPTGASENVQVAAVSANPVEAARGGGPLEALPPKSEPPICIKQVTPTFSEDARRQGYPGKVVLRIVVENDGTVGEIKVTSPLAPLVTEAVVAAVKQWLYKPALVGGKPVSVFQRVEVNVAMAGAAPPGK